MVQIYTAMFFLLSKHLDLLIFLQQSAQTKFLPNRGCKNHVSTIKFQNEQKCVAVVYSHHTLMCPVSGYSCELSLKGNPTHSGRLFFFAQLQIIQRRQKLEQIANIPLKIFSIELLQILNSSY